MTGRAVGAGKQADMATGSGGMGGVAGWRPPADKRAADGRPPYHAFRRPKGGEGVAGVQFGLVAAV